MKEIEDVENVLSVLIGDWIQSEVETCHVQTEVRLNCFSFDRDYRSYYIHHYFIASHYSLHSFEIPSHYSSARYHACDDFLNAPAYAITRKGMCHYLLLAS